MVCWDAAMLIGCRCVYSFINRLQQPNGGEEVANRASEIIFGEQCPRLATKCPVASGRVIPNEAFVLLTNFRL